MPKGMPNKRYTSEFKQQVVEAAVIQDGLSYKEAARLYDVQGHDRIQSWERIYLEEGPEGLAVERQRRRNTGRPKKLVSDELWSQVEPLLPEHKPTPKGGRLHILDRAALNAPSCADNTKKSPGRKI